MYLAGYGTIWDSPLFGALAPMFQLAPTAREVALYSPRCTTINVGNTPIINAPADPNIASPQTDYRIRIYDAAQSIQAVLPPVPRILLFDRNRNPSRNAADPSQPLVFSASGVEELSHICTAYNYWGVQGSPGGGGIKEMIADASSGRFVIHLTKDTPNEQGFALNFVVGVDIQPRMYRLVNRMKLSNGVSNAGWALIALRNGAFFSNAFNFATSANYQSLSNPLDLTGFAIGDTLSINLYNSSAGATGVDLYVDSIGLVPIGDVGWTTGTGVPNQGAFAAYAGQAVGAVYSQAVAQAADDAIKAVSQRLLALEQASAALAI